MNTMLGRVAGRRARRHNRSRSTCTQKTSPCGSAPTTVVVRAAALRSVQPPERGVRAPRCSFGREGTVTDTVGTTPSMWSFEAAADDALGIEVELAVPAVSKNVVRVWPPLPIAREWSARGGGGAVRKRGGEQATDPRRNVAGLAPSATAMRATNWARPTSRPRRALCHDSKMSDAGSSAMTGMLPVSRRSWRSSRVSTSTPER